MLRIKNRSLEPLRKIGARMKKNKPNRGLAAWLSLSSSYSNSLSIILKFSMTERDDLSHCVCFGAIDSIMHHTALYLEVDTSTSTSTVTDADAAATATATSTIN